MHGPKIHKILAKKGRETLRNSTHRAFVRPQTYESKLTLRATASQGEERPTLTPA